MEFRRVSDLGVETNTYPRINLIDGLLDLIASYQSFVIIVDKGLLVWLPSVAVCALELARCRGVGTIQQRKNKNSGCQRLISSTTHHCLGRLPSS